MTEADWLASEGPAAMLRALQDGSLVAADGRLVGPGEALWPGRRKLRLFACACLRWIWDDLPAAGRHAVEVAERHADGGAAPAELAAADAAARKDLLASSAGAAGPRWAASWVAVPDLDAAAIDAILRVPCVIANRTDDLVRDVVGNPFRPWARAREVRAAWVTPTVLAIAQAVYDERRFGETPVLADALEDAGCTNADVLSHLRSPGPHVRGCWALDLILGKG